MITKVKMLVADGPNELEKALNNWIREHPYSNILNIQYQIYKSGYTHHVGCVTYSDTIFDYFKE